jgi:Mn2+/Fe2+ NRAMP family transporter
MDVWFGMFMSNLVMFFIIITSAATLFQNGITNINSASDAALALLPFAGDFAFILFALGILGTGLLSIPVLAGSASYAVSESFGWREGLFRKFKQASAFYGVIAFAILTGVLLNFIGLNPIKTLIYSAILNGIISPIILYFIVRLGAREDVMGEHKNKILGNILGWLTVLIMSLVSIITIYFLLV